MLGEEIEYSEPEILSILGKALEQGIDWLYDDKYDNLTLYELDRMVNGVQ